MSNPKKSPVISKEKLTELQHKVTALGPRYTGNKAHKELINVYANEFEKLGLKVHRDKYTFKKWEAKSWKLTINDSNNSQEIQTTFYYPYSGFTTEEGVTADLIYLNNLKSDFKKATGKIAVIEVNNLKLPTALLIKKKQAFPGDISLPFFMRNTTVSSVLNGPDLTKAQEAGVVGIICIWKNLSTEEAHNQYLPFTKPLQQCPALWVDQETGERVKEAAQKGLEATIVLTADVNEQATSDTIYAVLPGVNNKENIIVNSHSDGPNSIEENGGIAVIAMADYFSKLPIKNRQYGMIFLIATGHMQIPQFGINGQATTRWLSDHPNLWDGQKTHAQTVAGLTVEHLGCVRDPKEVKDDGLSDLELVYTGNEKMQELYTKAVRDRQTIRSLTLQPVNNLYFGEGQPLFDQGIPTISLIPAPHYLLKEEKEGQNAYVDLDLMSEQIQTFIDLGVQLQKLDKKEIGQAAPYKGLLKFLGKKAH